MATSAAIRFEDSPRALGAQLDEVEQLLEEPTPGTLEELLLALDAAETEMAILEESGVHVDEERTRWEAIVHALEERPQLIAVPARGLPGGMSALRAAHPTARGFWWQADRMRSARLRSQLARAFLLLVLAAAVIWGAAWLWSYFFAPADSPSEASAAFLVTLSMLPAR